MGSRGEKDAEGRVAAGQPVFAFSLPGGATGGGTAEGGKGIRRFILPHNGAPTTRGKGRTRSHAQPQVGGEDQAFVGFLRSDSSCDIHPFKEGGQVLPVEGSLVWLDFLPVRVVPDPTTDSGDQQQQSSMDRRTSTVVVSLHERDGGEVEVKAWELRRAVSRGSAGTAGDPAKQKQQQHQHQRVEWKAIEVEVEVPLRMEKTLEHWKHAATLLSNLSTGAGAASGSPSTSTSSTPSASSPAPAVATGTSDAFSYLNAAKGWREGEEDEDEYRATSAGGRRSSMMPLPNPVGAHIASDGERVVIAAKGVPDICVWTASLHTLTLGKTRRRQLRLTFDRLLSSPGMEATCLALLPSGAVVAGTEHGLAVHQLLDKTDTNHAWSVISLDDPSPSVVGRTSITAVYPVERGPESATLACLDSQGGLYLVTLWLTAAPSEGTGAIARVLRLMVPFKLNKYLLTVLPAGDNLENGALIFAAGQCSIYLCTFKNLLLEPTKQRPQRGTDDATAKQVWATPVQLPLTRAILSESPVVTLAASAPFRAKEVDILYTVCLFVATVSGAKMYIV